MRNNQIANAQAFWKPGAEAIAPGAGAGAEADTLQGMQGPTVAAGASVAVEMFHAMQQQGMGMVPDVVTYRSLIVGLGAARHGA